MQKKDSAHQDNPEFEKIQPARIEITTQADSRLSADDRLLKEGNPHKKWLVLSFGLSAVLALAVFFMLPRVIEKPELVTPETVNPAPPAPEISPWQEAQWAKQRQEAQQVLEPLLDLQFELEELSVERWAGEDFTKAAELAARGDEYYRNREFLKAVVEYQNGLELLKSIKEESANVVKQQLEKGQWFLGQGDAESARKTFETVLLIQPGHQQAVNSLKRVAVLDQVLELTEQAEKQEQQGELAMAIKTLQQALTLDGQWQPASNALTRLRQKSTERAFAEAMSSGYHALQQQNLKDAEQRFARARQLKPDSQEALAGYEEAAHLITQKKIAAHRAQANQYQDQEQWAEAVKEFQAVLALDANLVFARQGLKQSADRARLDDLLEKQVADPGRLTSETVYAESLQLLKVAATVSNPGPRLRQQISRLQTMLREASKPVRVQLVSDDMTEVTLYRVGRLGNFSQHELSLKPGSYVLIGKRVGYRDVRKEFEVSSASASEPIRIQCVEKI